MKKIMSIIFLVLCSNNKTDYWMLINIDEQNTLNNAYTENKVPVTLLAYFLYMFKITIYNPLKENIINKYRTSCTKKYFMISSIGMPKFFIHV